MVIVKPTSWINFDADDSKDGILFYRSSNFR